MLYAGCGSEIDISTLNHFHLALVSSLTIAAVFPLQSSPQAPAHPAVSDWVGCHTSFIYFRGTNTDLSIVLDSSAPLLFSHLLLNVECYFMLSIAAGRFFLSQRLLKMIKRTHPRNKSLTNTALYYCIPAWSLDKHLLGQQPLCVVLTGVCR